MRSERAKRRRKDRNRKILLLSMNSFSILFLLFVTVSSRAGMTYGHFTSKAAIDGEIGICSVYPNQVEQLLEQFVQHVTRGEADYGSLSLYNGSNEEAIGIPDAAAASDEELQQFASSINARIDVLEIQQQAIDGLTGANDSEWASAQSEIVSAASILTQLSDYIGSVNLHCLAPEDPSMLDQFLALINGSRVASEAFQEQGRSIYGALSGSPSGMNATPLLVNEPAVISAAAAASYQAAQRSLSDARSAAVQQHSNLQQQLAQINAEIAAREQAKADAEANAKDGESTKEQADGETVNGQAADETTSERAAGEPAEEKADESRSESVPSVRDESAEQDPAVPENPSVNPATPSSDSAKEQTETADHPAIPITTQPNSNESGGVSNEIEIDHE
ncbi:hypothetical protein [Paenibacillus sacheonensis]|uniref:Uncharacterized protein n=1 Tax=Paenibacillus sacheonensis TaxID=742054 RepID=A0A7X4YV71_9BACL|nr:hypothetical protein [Paenibacillus sacheonensis]NBC73211.1 hypothetical protein [Paenibacillus sacheonensis]